jgi:hypothetical protein
VCCRGSSMCRCTTSSVVAGCLQGETPVPSCGVTDLCPEGNVVLPNCH